MMYYLATILCLIAIYVYQCYTKSKIVMSKLKKIPCEKGLPIIGVVREIEKSLCNYLLKLSQKHGPIYCVKFGMRDVVILNTFDSIKAALVDNGEALSGRWKAHKYVMVSNDSGIVFTMGNVWSEHRSFVLKTLKDFGVGRSRAVDIIQEECMYLLDDLENWKGKSVRLASFLSIYTFNVISKFVMNKRFSRGDLELKMVAILMESIIKQEDPVANFLLMFPCLENNDWLMKFIMWITSRKALFERSYCYLEKKITEHLTEINFDSEGDDLIDRLLIKQHQLREREGNVETFTDFQIMRDMLELLAAGYDTTSTSLWWSLMIMAMYQDSQNKIYEEIIDKIGKERLPTMGDKVSLNYTQAVMDETFRLSSVFPLSIMRRTLSDVNVKGYFIPKDTVVIPNIFACHLDPRVWERPYEFYPQHFLARDANQESKYKPREELIFFSMGKRQCLGEALARMEIFIFFTSILQRFHVRLAKEEAGFNVFHGNEGMIRTPFIEDFILDGRK